MKPTPQLSPRQAVGHSDLSKKSSQLSEALAIHRKCLQDIGDALSQLEIRLGPVLDVPQPVEDVAKDSDVEHDNVVLILVAYTNLVGAMSGRAKQLLGRLQV